MALRVVSMYLDRHRKFLEDLRHLNQDAIQASQKSVELSERAKTGHSQELIALRKQSSERATDLSARFDQVIGSYVQPNFLERMFGIKPSISQWTRWRSMAKKDIAQLPVEQRSAAVEELKDLDVLNEEVKNLVLRFPSATDEAVKAAKESVWAADKEIKKADRDIAEMKAELARRQKLKGAPPSK